jgi:hypothetical protein
MVLSYVKDKTNINLSEVYCNSHNVFVEKDFSLTIGNALFNDDYLAFAYNHGCRNPSNL